VTATGNPICYFESTESVYLAVVVARCRDIDVNVVPHLVSCRRWHREKESALFCMQSADFNAAGY